MCGFVSQIKTVCLSVTRARDAHVAATTRVSTARSPVTLLFQKHLFKTLLVDFHHASPACEDLPGGLEGMSSCARSRSSQERWPRRIVDRPATGEEHWSTAATRQGATSSQRGYATRTDETDT